MPLDSDELAHVPSGVLWWGTCEFTFGSRSFMPLNYYLHDCECTIQYREHFLQPKRRVFLDRQQDMS
jgi:hypothetical protein